MTRAPTASHRRDFAGGGSLGGRLGVAKGLPKGLRKG